MNFFFFWSLSQYNTITISWAPPIWYHDTATLRYLINWETVTLWTSLMFFSLLVAVLISFFGFLSRYNAVWKYWLASSWYHDTTILQYSINIWWTVRELLFGLSSCVSLSPGCSPYILVSITLWCHHDILSSIIVTVYHDTTILRYLVNWETLGTFLMFFSLLWLLSSFLFWVSIACTPPPLTPPLFFCLALSLSLSLFPCSCISGSCCLFPLPECFGEVSSWPTLLARCLFPSRCQVPVDHCG